MAKEEKGDSDSLFGPGFHQTIALTGRERAYTVHNYEVVIHASPSSSISNNSTSGSSNVQVSTITNQSWELPVHPGNMVASNSNYIAYVLEGRSGYVVRLIHRHTNSRTLLKGFTGPVLDVAFSPSAASLLACVDQGGNLFVWDLSKTDLGLSDANSTLRLHSERSSAPDHTHHRLSWCPYVAQEEGEDEEEGWLLAVSHGCEVEVYNLGQLLPASGSGGESPVVLHGGDEAPGRFIIPSPHSKPVYDISISPDGGVLATSSEDGHLKFWQINWDNVVPETLHDFSPHGGEAVTRLIFCDDHTTRDELAQYWRFLITGANGNREVKLWCTVTWRCLQTFHFLPPEEGSSDSSEPNILLNLDTSASYLIATDTRRMV
jgi:enhancer of mRNA-decapping protein 4